MPTVCELKQTLKERGISGYSGKNKEELIKMLAKNSPEPKPEPEPKKKVAFAGSSKEHAKLPKTVAKKIPKKITKTFINNYFDELPNDLQDKIKGIAQKEHQKDLNAKALKNKANELYDKYKALDRAKYTNAVRNQMNIVGNELSVIALPMLIKELEKGYFTIEDDKKITFRVIPAKTYTGAASRLSNDAYLLFEDGFNGSVIDSLMSRRDYDGGAMYQQLWNAIKTKYKYRMIFGYNATADLKDADDLKRLLPVIKSYNNWKPPTYPKNHLKVA